MRLPLYIKKIRLNIYRLAAAVLAGSLLLGVPVPAAAKVPKTLMVSGSPVGIRLDSEGVTVLGFVGFMSEGTFVNPGVSGGLQIGDCILKVNGVPVRSSEELRSVVSASKDGALSLQIIRNRQEQKLSLKARMDEEQGEYRLGIWVRDRITGIGTMTFYDPESGSFAALGHGISDENGLLPIAGGSVSPVVILDAIKGKVGSPGELKGCFPEPETESGTVLLNTEYGIYGTAESGFPDGFSWKIYPVCEGGNVRTGAATILCTVCGNTPAEYAVEITGTYQDRIGGTKGLKIRVTDPRLLEKTGGIVQGMSGSPIIQDGKLIGAVTHVLVGDPTTGYGIFAEKMIETAQSAANRGNKAKEAS